MNMNIFASDICKECKYSEVLCLLSAGGTDALIRSVAAAIKLEVPEGRTPQSTVNERETDERPIVSPTRLATLPDMHQDTEMSQR